MADNRSALHQGQATERNVDSASARVGFDDLSGTVSGFMQVLFPAAGGWNFFYTPKEGDQVVVSRLPNGVEEGYILGKVYTANKMPQGGAPNIFLMVSDDGKNIVKFDSDKGTLDIICDQGCSLKTKQLDVEVTETVNLKAKNVNVENSDSITVKATNNANIEAKNATIKAAQAKITGGTLEVQGSVAPNGTGAFCGMPFCQYTGAPQSGPQVSNT
jgi:phage baseplate assembly protein gpV